MSINGFQALLLGKRSKSMFTLKAAIDQKILWEFHCCSHVEQDRVDIHMRI